MIRYMAIHMKKEKIKRFLRMILRVGTRCCKVGTIVEISYQDKNSMDYVEDFINAAEIAVDSWRYPGSSVALAKGMIIYSS